MTPITDRRVPPVDWPTVLLGLTIYGGWAALTWFWRELPAAVIVGLGGWLVAWFMSLQHELIHGHPTRHQWLNDALGFAPLALWLPYVRYKQLHLIHHNDEQLTDPKLDPESAYVDGADWAATSRFGRWLHRVTETFVGRLIVAPWRSVWELWRSDAAKILAGDRELARSWLLHLVGVAAVTGWLMSCGISLLAYALLVVWPATGLTKLRSLAEHREAERVEDRTAIVERGGALGLLFLFNNLHVVHHNRPALPWYWLPAAWTEQKPAILASWHGPYYRTYLDVFAQWFVTPHNRGPRQLPAGGAALDLASDSRRNERFFLECSQ